MIADFSPQAGTCVSPPQITLPSGYTCQYTFLVDAGVDITACDEVTTPQTGIVQAQYCSTLGFDQHSGTVTFTVMDPCGATMDLEPLEYFCLNCNAGGGAWGDPVISDN